MQLKTLAAFSFLFLLFWSCNGKQEKTVAEKKAAEQQRRNPMKKGRYRCYIQSSGGDKVAPDLFVLSDNIYQVNDTTGRYSYDHRHNAMHFLNGPLKQSEALIGYYLPKDAPTSGGGKTLESMIQFKRSDTGRIVILCNYAEFE